MDRAFLYKELQKGVTTGNTALVRDMLEAGADPNYRSFEHSPLWEACARNNEAILDMLWMTGARFKNFDKRATGSLPESFDAWRRGAQRLSELRDGEDVPTPDTLWLNHNIHFDLDEHRRNLAKSGATLLPAERVYQGKLAELSPNLNP